VEYVCGLVFLLAAVTVVGHGIWVLLASFFASPQVPHVRPRCERCFSLKENAHVPCAVCNWPQPLPTHREDRIALGALARQLLWFRDLGLLQPETAERLLSAMEADAAEPDAGTGDKDAGEKDLVENPAAKLSGDSDSALDDAVTSDSVDVSPASAETPTVVMAEIVGEEGKSGSRDGWCVLGLSTVGLECEALESPGSLAGWQVTHCRQQTGMDWQRQSSCCWYL